MMQAGLLLWEIYILKVCLWPTAGGTVVYDSLWPSVLWALDFLYLSVSVLLPAVMVDVLLCPSLGGLIVCLYQQIEVRMTQWCYGSLLSFVTLPPLFRMPWRSDEVHLSGEKNKLDLQLTLLTHTTTITNLFECQRESQTTLVEFSTPFNIIKLSYTEISLLLTICEKM